MFKLIYIQYKPAKKKPRPKLIECMQGYKLFLGLINKNNKNVKSGNKKRLKGEKTKIEIEHRKNNKRRSDIILKIDVKRSIDKVYIGK